MENKKTLVKIEYYRKSGKWYTNYEYISDIPTYERMQIQQEVEKQPWYILGMNYTIEVEELNNDNGPWDKYLIVV